MIAYASSFGQTRKIAETIAADIRRDGHVVEPVDTLASTPPPVQPYDAVILGSRVQYGTHARPIINYIVENRANLEKIPSYFFSVSMGTVSAPAPDPQGYLAKLFEATHWRPRDWISIAGSLPYRKYGFLLRSFMKLISWRNGHTTDTSRDHEYTDWAQVHRFAAGIATDLALPKLFPGTGIGRDTKGPA